MSGQSGVKVEPSFRITTPHGSRDERPSLSHVMKLLLSIHALEKGCLNQQKQSLYALMYQLPKTEIVMFDGNPLHYHLFIKTIENSEEKFTEDGDIRLQLLIQYCTGKAREAIKSWECLMVCRATKRQRSSERNMLCLRRRLTSFPRDLQLD